MTLRAAPKTRLILMCLGVLGLFLANCDAGSQVPEPISEAQSSSARSADNPLAYIRSVDPAASNDFFETNRQLFEYDQEVSLDIQEVSSRIEDGLSVIEITYASPKGGRVPATLIVPLLFQNAVRDQYVNVRDAIRYQDMASEPKHVIWYDSEHWPLPDGAIMDSAKWLQQFIGPGALYLVPAPNYRPSAVMIDRLLMVWLSITVISLAFLIWNLSRQDEEFLIIQARRRAHMDKRVQRS